MILLEHVIYPTNMLFSGRMLTIGTPFLFHETELQTHLTLAQSGSLDQHSTAKHEKVYQPVTQDHQLYHRQFIHDAVELCQAKDTLKVQKTRCCCYKPATRSHPRKNTAPVNITQNLKSATTENVAGSRLSSPAHSLSRRMPCHTLPTVHVTRGRQPRVASSWPSEPISQLIMHHIIPLGITL
jgi:hypothetical protein